MDEKIKELKYDLIEVDHSLHGRILPFEKDFRDMEAEGLYKKGYRKIPGGAVVLTREELDAYEERISSAYELGYKESKNKIVKETAEKFAERVVEKHGYDPLTHEGDEDIDICLTASELYEICKEIMEGDNG